MKAVICRARLITVCTAACAALGSSFAGHAAQGLATPQPDTWWPQWQVRLNLQAAPAASHLLSGRGGAATGLTPRRSIQTGALLGDYYFASQLAGHFRASGGLMMGLLGGAPLGVQPIDSADAVPYLGLGYSGSLWRDSIALTADLGLVSERPGAAGNVGRAVFGNQGMNQALRELRLQPVLQLGMRYTF